MSSAGEQGCFGPRHRIAGPGAKTAQPGSALEAAPEVLPRMWTCPPSCVSGNAEAHPPLELREVGTIVAVGQDLGSLRSLAPLIASVV